MKLDIIVLAAGKGNRMLSSTPKMLQPLATKPLLQHVIETVQTLAHHNIYVVYGYEGEQIKATMQNYNLQWVKQEQQLGTGDAVRCALALIDDDHHVLIVYGDVPLITTDTLQPLLDPPHDFCMLTAKLDDPYGYGRIIKNEKDQITAIIEEADADQQQREITEVNTGIMVVKNKLLKKWIAKIEDNNQQQELYLTAIVKEAHADKHDIKAHQTHNSTEIKGVNNIAQLIEAERYYQQRAAYRLMAQGVMIMDPHRFDVRTDTLKVGANVRIDINVIIEGQVSIGNNVRIAANCHIKDTDIGDDVEVLANTVIEGAQIKSGCRIGPYARIRPETVLHENVHVGNFVEIKKANIGQQSKANHLSYIGDSDIGNQVNIGANVVTCNYDGKNKHKTIIGNNVFVGSDVQLIAPITIEDGATIAAGTTVTKNVQKNELAIARPEQKSIKNWKKS